ncbi:hypothetical protein BDN72DRAFT_906565 [Pluteus cervinus]|uniref:Uncharacterized protein n=1 Tax=Pluteus cervinus TaxID=181527 RepID=A0ACD2ZYV7_9AGAR|nr:hypothetical protein BDN72DRAFT_906565 [Pluteus cervinus]
MDYHEVFRPRMDMLVVPPPVTDVAHTIGVFISNHGVAQMYYNARLPFWFIEKRSLFCDQNILLVTEMVQPKAIIEIHPIGAAIPYVSVGERALFYKFQAIHDRAAPYLSYRDLSAPTPQPQTTSSSSSSAPTHTSQSSSTMDG